MHGIQTSRGAIVTALSVPILVAAMAVTTVSAQPQQPQYGEGPGVVTRTFPTTGSGDVQQPIYGEGPGVIGSKLPNTGSGDVSQPIYGEGPGVIGSKLPNTGSGDVQQPVYGEGPGVSGSKLPKTGEGPAHTDAAWGVLVLIAGVASGLLAVLWARGRKLAARAAAQRVLVVTRG